MLKWIFPRTRAVVAIRDFPVRETALPKKVFLLLSFLRPPICLFLPNTFYYWPPFHFVDDLVVLIRGSNYRS